MRTSLNFDKDQSISWGDIPIFMTSNNLENNKKGIFASKIIAQNKGGILNFWDTFLNMFAFIFSTLPLIERTQKDSLFFV